MNIDKHPLLKECHDLSVAIEACGASPELTNAVDKTGKLMANINILIDQIYEAKSALESSERPFFEGMSALNNISDNN